MSSALKSYVEKYLLNPAASFNVDDEGNQETKAQVVDSLLDEERADGTQQGISKLRARRAALDAEKDPRYKGKTVLRKDLKKKSQAAYDPELAKFCILEGSEEEDGDDNAEEDVDEEEEEEGEDDDVEEEEDEDEVNDKRLSQKLNKSGTERSYKDEEDEEYDGSSEENEEVTKLYQTLQKNQKGVKFIDDGDFSKFADDDEDDDDDDDDEDDDDDDEEGEEEDEDKDVDTEGAEQQEAPLRKFRQDDPSEEVKKGQAVKNQLGIYDSLFEGRIGMQKVVTASNQLPQHDTYKLFLREQDPNYIKNLTTAKAASKKLLNSILQVQELLLRQYPETNPIVTGKAPKETGTESNEEITSSEEEEQQQEGTAAGFQGLKRKMKLEEYEEVLSKRHAAVLPFRDQTINKWYDKTKLLSSRSARNNKFSGFETSALQQLHNLLTNKQKLILRTQMTGTTRGTTYHILGRTRDAAKLESEEYDTEIFDDTDFYTRALEEVLKAKVSLSDNMTDVSRKWIEIQNLRRKAKKNVDKKASKGRKIRYEVLSKLQQYMAPSRPPHMDDRALNTLFASLFGKAVQKQRTPKVE